MTAAEPGLIRVGPPAEPALEAKRLFDLAVSVLGLAATSPLLGAIALAVRLDSDGPVIFRQDRVGRGGRVFRIHKFRTLRAGGGGPSLTPSGDARVTRVGRVLRQTKLDELPQLIDVLRGDMSLVGPRPELPRYVARWPAGDRELILSVRPGITDPASVAFRNEAELLATADDPEEFYIGVLLPQKVAAYVDYVRRRSFVGDLRVLGRTAVTVLAG